MNMRVTTYYRNVETENCAHAKKTFSLRIVSLQRDIRHSPQHFIDRCACAI